MLSGAEIEHNLDEIQRLYDATSDPLESKFYAKLATLELCGWIEAAVDEMVIRTGRRLISDRSELEKFEQQVVERTHGFHYTKHIRPILVNLVGLVGVARLEAATTAAHFVPMCAELGHLKSARDRHAHNYINGATLTIDAPSVTRGRYSRVTAGLSDLESELDRLS